jgi:Flp pilus assembly protein TadG
VASVFKKCRGKIRKQLVNITQMLFKEQGSVIILVALGLVVLLGCAALVVDIGLLYTSRSRLVNTADAAALAGAQELPMNPQLAMDVAREYVLANGISGDELVIEVGADNQSITVKPRQNVHFLFARVLGFTDQEVNASATAFTGSLTGAIGVVPFSIEEQELVKGAEYLLKQGAGTAVADADGKMHGWYSALAFGDGGADQYREHIKNGCQTILRVGDRIPIETGNMSGPTSQGVEYRIAQCKKGCTHSNFDLECPRIMIVPMIKVVSPAEVEITGFAAFFLEGVGGSGNENYVVGRFVKMVVSGELGGGTDYGAYAVKLLY